VPRSPWQNPHCERSVDSICRERFVHVIVLNWRHLRCAVTSYFAHFTWDGLTHPSTTSRRLQEESVSLPRSGYRDSASRWSTSWGSPRCLRLGLSLRIPHGLDASGLPDGRKAVLQVRGGRLPRWLPPRILIENRRFSRRQASRMTFSGGAGHCFHDLWIR